MKKIIKEYYKEFLMRGCLSAGGGPLVLAIVYLALELSGVPLKLSGVEIFWGIISVSVLAFIAGGITVIHKIEEIGLSVSIALHGTVLYFLYLLVYLFNGWLKIKSEGFVIFTICFIIGYLLIWGIIFFTTKRKTDKLNAIMNRDA